MSNRVDPGITQKRSGEDTAMPDQEPQSRRAKSLVEITKRFLRLLQESEDGILDLKEASKVLRWHSTSKLRLKRCALLWSHSKSIFFDKHEKLAIYALSKLEILIYFKSINSIPTEHGLLHTLFSGTIFTVLF